MRTKEMTLCALFSAWLCICGFISLPLPFTSVMMTLQVLAVCVAGAVLGWKNGLRSVVLYILLGAVGLPVFSGFKGGVGVLMGPTGGYISGFIFLVIITGVVSQKMVKASDSLWVQYGKLGSGMVLGVSILYLLGTLQFMLVTKNSFVTSLMMAVIPFIPVDLLKISIALPLSVHLKRYIMLGNMV